MKKRYLIILIITLTVALTVAVTVILIKKSQIEIKEASNLENKTVIENQNEFANENIDEQVAENTANENVKETLYENHIAKTLVENGFSLYYYQSSGKAEVNFVIQNRNGQIIPLELTTKENSKAKSLSVFMKRFTVAQAYRITENNFSTKKDVRYIPIYAIFCLNDNKI